MPAELSFSVAILEELSPALTAHSGQGASFQEGPAPNKAGIYVWIRPGDEAVLYVGSAASLAIRLGREQSWVDGHDPEADWEVSVVHMIKRFGATARWHEQSTHQEALELERRLIEWHRAVTGVAPLLVGWDAKPGSPTYAARTWAQTLWSEENPRPSHAD